MVSHQGVLENHRFFKGSNKVSEPGQNYVRKEEKALHEGDINSIIRAMSTSEILTIKYGELDFDMKMIIDF